jgi:hypothetical protein
MKNKNAAERDIINIKMSVCKKGDEGERTKERERETTHLHLITGVWMGTIKTIEYSIGSCSNFIILLVGIGVHIRRIFGTPVIVDIPMMVKVYNICDK